MMMYTMELVGVCPLAAVVVASQLDLSIIDNSIPSRLGELFKKAD